jgi:hypothetical protein
MGILAKTITESQTFLKVSSSFADPNKMAGVIVR